MTSYRRPKTALAGIDIRPSAVALAVATTALPAAAQSGDAAAGERAYRQCAACHSVEPGQNRAGPHLHGIVGRQAGTVERFRYSRAMREADIVWDDAALTAYLTDPRGYLPGTSKTFRLRRPEQVPDLLAYLNSLRDN